MSAGRDDLRLALSFPWHVKKRLLQRDCGAEGVVALITLWCYAGLNHPEGILPSEEIVEAAGEWSGKPGKLLAALKKHGWIEKDGRTLHDWTSEQPWITTRPQRTASAKRAARARWDAVRMQSACDSHQPADAPDATRIETQCPPLLSSPSPPKTSLEPAVPVVVRTPLQPAPPTAGTAGTTGSSAPPLNGNGRYDRIGEVGPKAPRASPNQPDVDRGAPRASAANGGATTAVLADEPDPPPAAAPLDPTSVAAILRELAPDDLGDPKRFEPFFHRLRRAGKAPNPERQLVSHFALALECRRVGRNPVGLFIARIEEGDWSRVKPDDFAAAELALGRRDAAGPAENARREEAAESKLGFRLPKDVPAELRDRLHAAEPRTREFQEAMEAIASWRNEHAPGPRRVDPDAAGVSVAAFVDRMRGRKVE